MISKLINKICYAIIKYKYKSGDITTTTGKITVIEKEDDGFCTKVIPLEEFINRFVCCDFKDFINKLPKKYTDVDKIMKNDVVVDNMCNLRKYLITEARNITIQILISFSMTLISIFGGFILSKIF